jgi:hypothetical protein
MPVKHKLSDINPLEVSTCKKGAFPPANKLILKSDDPPAVDKFNFVGPIRAVDNPKKQIFAYVYGPDIVDSQNHFAEAEEVEKAAHRFMLNMVTGRVSGYGIGDKHEDFTKFDYPIESIIDRDGTVGLSFGFNEEDCVKGGWLIGVQCCNETWEKVESGEIAAISLGGEAMHTPVEAADEGEGAALTRKFSHAIKVRFDQLIRKDGPTSFDEALATRQNRDALWQILDAFVSTVISITFAGTIDKKEKKGKLSDAIKQFSGAMAPILAADPIQFADADLPESISKSSNDDNSKKIDGGTTMSPDEIKKLIAEQTEPVKKSVDDLTAKIEALGKGGGTDGKAPDGNDDAEPNGVTKVLDKMTKTLTALDGRIKKLETKPAIRNGQDGGDSKPVKKRIAEGTAFDLGGKETAE